MFCKPLMLSLALAGLAASGEVPGGDGVKPAAESRPAAGRRDALPVWQGGNLASWREQAHQCAEVRVTDAGLRLVGGGTDTHVYSCGFSIPARPTQEFVFRAKCDRSGTGELFWMPPGKGPQQKWSVRFEWIGDGAWHDYRVRPYWQGEKTIGRLRLDLPPGAADGGVFEFEKMAIEDAAKALEIPADRYSGVLFSLKASADGVGVVRWAGDGESGVKTEEIRIPGDGRSHRYYLALADRRGWQGLIGLMQVDVPDGVAPPSDLTFVEDEPDLPADLILRGARASDAFNRAGSSVSLTVLVENLGTREAKDVSLAAELPEGVTLVNAAECSGLAVSGGETLMIAPVLRCRAAGEFTAVLTVSAPGCVPLKVEIPVVVRPSLNLPKAAYVPVPQPVATDYDIAALYFPGWWRAEDWQRVWRRCPERKPVLGWYDESNPEVVDWQIKWLVENGIRTLYVDWYWHKGHLHLDHWVKAFYRARYKSYIKWAMMWANHNAPGSHSVEDQRAVTKFWIENYFNTPEYLRIDDMPVVWMWSPQNMERDVGAGGCRRLLEISREMARAAGFKGIHFIAMKWPEADCSPETIRKYKDFGFDMTGIYHFMSHGGREASSRRFSFKSVAAANPENWWRQHEAGILPFLPNLSTGWDDRPWNDHCEIYGKNADDFRRICQEAKAFADKTGVRRLCLAPLNEWGEGSYAEPNAEHGFGFYEAVRDVFCRRPATGWPLNFGPKDVGLGPYDFPPPEMPKRVTAWSFADGRAQGWKPQMGVADFVAAADGLSMTATTYDPAVCSFFAPVETKNFTKVVVRMKVEASGPTFAQLFWSGPGRTTSENASVRRPVVADGAFHDYVFDVAANRRWQGRVNHLRFDPTDRKDAKVVIASIRLEK
ncbi:MAG: glycoside hydrolase family 99-like domain-containing protein [Kiritimatiellia bacterium]